MREKLIGVENSLGEGAEASKGEKSFGPSSQTMYLKAIPLKRYEDVELIQVELKAGNIVIMNISPLARDNINDLKKAIVALSEFVAHLEGDIARLGEDRVVMTPKNVKIWRTDLEKKTT